MSDYRHNQLRQTDLTAGTPAVADFLPPVIGGKTRAALWFLLLAMTAILILYPATLKYEYSIHAMPFLYIFDNFSLFTALYYIWLFLLFILLFSGGGGRRADWEKAALVGIFALVFTGYGSFVSRGLAGDAFVPAGDIKNFAALGQFSSAPALKYNGFPGLSLLGTAVCLITGMGATDFITFFPFLQVLIFSMIIYLFFRKLLKDPYFASLGAILMIELDISVSTSLAQFHPGAFAPFVLLAAALLLIGSGRSDDSGRSFRLESREALLLVMVTALYFSHFVTSLVALLTILGIYIIQKISRQRMISTPLVVVLVLVPLVWNLAANLSIIRYFAGMVPGALEVLTSGDVFQNWLLPLQTNTFVGERALWWTVPSTIAGPVLLVAVGGLLGLARLTKIRKLNVGEVLSLAGLAASVILGLVLLWLGGIQEAYGRVMVYIGFFTVPLILFWLFGRKKSRKFVFTLLVAGLFLVSLPSFLSSSKGIASMTYYPSEVAGGEFLETGFGRGDGMHIFGVGTSAYYVPYYLPDAYQDAAYAPGFRSRDIEDIWRGVNDYVSSIRRIVVSGGADSNPGPGVVMFSPKWDTPFRDYTGAEVENSAAWRQLESRLAENDLIYSNSFLQIYYVTP